MASQTEKAITDYRNRSISKIPQNLTSATSDELLRLFTEPCNTDHHSGSHNFTCNHTVLHFALCKQDELVIGFILQSLTQPHRFQLLTTSCRYCRQPLQLAIRKRWEKMINEILKYLDGNQCKDAFMQILVEDKLPLYYLLKNQCWNTIESLVKKLTSDQLVDLLSARHQLTGTTFLHSVATNSRFEHWEHVRKILKHIGHDQTLRLLAIEVSQKLTPLHISAENGNSKLVSIFLDCSENTSSTSSTFSHRKLRLLNIVNSSELRPIDLAAVKGNYETFEIMLSAVPKSQLMEILSYQNASGETILHQCAKKESCSVFKCSALLLKRLSPSQLHEILKIQDANGNTAFHCHMRAIGNASQDDASQLNDIKILKKLQSQQVFSLLMIQNNRRDTALHVAANHTGNIPLLVRHLPNYITETQVCELLNLEDKFQRKPLDIALSWKNLDLADCLQMHEETANPDMNHNPGIYKSRRQQLYLLTKNVNFMSCNSVCFFSI